MQLKPPFPWFGGKRRVADMVWSRLGDVDVYIEPFFGGGAVLLNRPNPHGVEIVNDIDGYLTNAWRAIQKDPDAVAEYVDWPVNEADLIARHIWLVQNPPDVERLMGDPDYYDAQKAGWWIWGLCCWIGGDWCSGKGPWTSVDGRLVRGSGVQQRRPDISGRGVMRQELHGIPVKRPSYNECCVLRSTLHGVSIRRPHVTHTGNGVIAIGARQRHMTNEQGIIATDSLPFEGQCQRSREALIRYMRLLSDRLRHVKICCGDWKRVLSDAILMSGKKVGIFLDPPYDPQVRSKGCYNHEEPSVSAEVRQWCLEHGDDPRFRIALCGYEGEHEMPETWEKVAWTARRCMSRRHKTQNSDNRFKERTWFGPHCIRMETPVLFEEVA